MITGHAPKSLSIFVLHSGSYLFQNHLGAYDVAGGCVLRIRGDLGEKPVRDDYVAAG
jgi:hypothetical protein